MDITRERPKPLNDSDYRTFICLPTTWLKKVTGKPIVTRQLHKGAQRGTNWHNRVIEAAEHFMTHIKVLIVGSAIKLQIIHMMYVSLIHKSLLLDRWAAQQV